MPFAGFENFAECVRKQMADGKSKESANKICGALKHKAEGEEQETIDWLLNERNSKKNKTK